MMKKNVPWVDVLRILACFLVVLAHSCDPFVAQFDANRSEFVTGALIGSMLRPCVPLFVMISGFLLFPIGSDTTTFYSKRLKRVLWPLVFWSLVTPLLYFGYLLNFPTTNPGVDLGNFTLNATLTKLYAFVFNFTYDTTPLWYLYMLIGIYLFMPIFGAWLNVASQKEVKRFLYLWGVSMVLPYVQMLAPVLGYTGNYGNMGILGVCEWNLYGTFYYFSGFMGYAVLAHYLAKYPLRWNLKQTLARAIPLFLIGYAITSLGFLYTQEQFPGSYANLEIIWYFSGINVFMMTFAVYITIQKIHFKGSPFLSRIAGLTFGVYLCHFIFVQIGYDVIYPIGGPAAVKIILIALFAFGVSLGLTWVLSRIKWIKMVSGN